MIPLFNLYRELSFMKIKISGHRPTSKKSWAMIALLFLLFTLLPSLALAEEAPVLNSGDTAWMLTATALVLFMTIPGLSLFYAGMVRSKNILSVLMQCFAITSLMTILWVLYAYSIAFGGDGPYWGGLSKMFLAGVSVDTLSGTIPETVFMTFQMTFAIITPALMVGAFAERMKFSTMLVFMTIWITIVYAPVCHWVWGGGGWLGNKGILDFAGGTVVHINAGMAGLVAALLLGKRKGYPTTAMPPHNLGYTLVGASMLWVGWFGFNAGSELAADGVAGMAMAVTQVATATAALAWMAIEWVKHGKPSVGNCFRCGGRLGGHHPGIGRCQPHGRHGDWVCVRLWLFLRIHAVGGIIGAILTGVFCAESLGGAGFGGDITSIGDQLAVQFIGVGATVVYTGVVSFIILKVLDGIMGLRVTDEEEAEGLDLALHDERGYII